MTPEQLAPALRLEGAQALFLESSSGSILDEIHTLHASKRGDLLVQADPRPHRPVRAEPAAGRPVGDRRRSGGDQGLDGRPFERWERQHRPGARPAAKARADRRGAAVEAQGAVAAGDGVPHATCGEVWRRSTTRSRTALVFVNTRFQAEFAFQELWRANEEAARRSRPHHGSLAAEQRCKVEVLRRAASFAPWSAPRRSTSASTGATWTWSSNWPRPRCFADGAADRPRRNQLQPDEAQPGAVRSCQPFRRCWSATGRPRGHRGEQAGRRPAPGRLLDVLAQHVARLRLLRAADLPERSSKSAQSGGPYRDLIPGRTSSRSSISSRPCGWASSKTYEQVPPHRERPRRASARAQRRDRPAPPVDLLGAIVSLAMLSRSGSPQAAVAAVARSARSKRAWSRCWSPAKPLSSPVAGLAAGGRDQPRRAGSSPRRERPQDAVVGRSEIRAPRPTSPSGCAN